MKKIFFLLAFVFIGQQAFSQVYMLAISEASANCPNLNDHSTLLKVDPAGVETTMCIPNNVVNGALGQLNQEINSIINLGYKLTYISIGERVYSPNYAGATGLNMTGGLLEGERLTESCVIIFAIP